MNQLPSIPGTPDSNKTPLPILVARKWRFELAYIDRDGNPDNYLYCARDWFIGLGGSRQRWANTDKSRYRSTILAPVKRANGKTDKLEFVNANDLYAIAQDMRGMQSRPQLQEIKDYLRDAGVVVDQLRRDPVKAMDVALDGYQKQGKDDLWIQSRMDGKLSNKQFRAALVEAVGRMLTEGEFAGSQNTVYQGLWNRTAAQLKSELSLKKHQSLRDHQPTLALQYQSIAEQTAATKLGTKEYITLQEAQNVVRIVAQMIGRQARETGQALGIDLATGRPLLSPPDAS